MILNIDKIIYGDVTYNFVKDEIFDEIIPGVDYFYKDGNTIFDEIIPGVDYFYKDGNTKVHLYLLRESVCLEHVNRLKNNIASKFWNLEFKRIYYGFLQQYNFYEGGYFVRIDSSQVGNYEKMYMKLNDNLLHCEFGPARILFWKGGVVKEQCYYLNGKILAKGEWEAEMLTKLYW